MDMNDYEKTFKQIRRGDIVEGTVIQVKNDGIMLNIGYKADAFIPISELTYENEAPDFKIGDTLKVEVLKLENEDGNVLASKKRVEVLNTWEDLKKNFEENIPITGTVNKVVNGGVLSNVKGLRCFIPASHLDLRHIDNLEEFIGKDITMYILELDEKKRRLVGSRRNYLLEEQKNKRKEILNKLEVGQVVKGVVKNITNYGAFIDIGGIDGLMRIGEMSWGRIKHPSDIMKIDDELEVYITDFDKEKEKIGLSLKRLKPEPWTYVNDKYHVGDKINGGVTGVTEYGAFIELEPGLEGLLHKSHMNGRTVKKDDKLDVTIINIDADKRRISLSLEDDAMDQN